MRLTVETWRSVVLSSLVLGYGGYYLCKSNLPVISPYLTSHGPAEFSNETLGLLVSIGTLCHALSKLVCGVAVDLLGGKWLFIGGMVLSSMFTFLYGFWGTDPTIFTIGWAGTRFVQAVGWPAIIAITPRWVPADQQGKTFAVLSFSYLFGDAIVRLFLGQLMRWGWHWQQVVNTSAGLLLCIAVVCCFTIFESPDDVNKKPRSKSEDVESIRDLLHADPLPLPSTTARDKGSLLHATSASDASPQSQHGTNKHGRSLYRLVVPLLLDPCFWSIGLLNAALTIIRETFRDWTVVFLRDAVKMSNADAAQASVVFPIAGAAANYVAGLVIDRLDKRHRGPFLLGFCVAMLCSIASLWFLTTTAVVSPAIAVTLVAAVGFFNVPPHALCGSVLAVEIGGTGRSATAATLFEAMGYFGAMFSGVITGKLSEDSWTPVFMVMCLFSLLSAASVCLYWAFAARRHRRNTIKLEPAYFSMPLEVTTKETKGT